MCESELVRESECVRVNVCNTHTQSVRMCARECVCEREYVCLRVNISVCVCLRVRE